MLEDFSKREQLKCSEIVGEALSLPKLTQRSGSLEWKLPKIFEFVGVANLATRAALPLAGGYEPPLLVRWKPGAGGSPGWRPLPVRFKIWERLQNRTRPVGEALSLPKRTQQSALLNGTRQNLLSL